MIMKKMGQKDIPNAENPNAMAPEMPPVIANETNTSSIFLRVLIYFEGGFSMIRVMPERIKEPHWVQRHWHSITIDPSGRRTGRSIPKVRVPHARHATGVFWSKFITLLT